MKKQKLVIFIAILFIFTLISGCINDSIDIFIDDIGYQNAPRDSFVFNSVKLIQNFFLLNVSYGGGCEEHIFLLISTSFMESNPVQVNVILSHEDNDDPCDAWITEEFVFNLLPLKKAYQEKYQVKFGKIILNLEGWEDSLTYKF
jgi:hypothetical protein